MNLNPENVLAILNRAVAERNDPQSGVGGQAEIGRELGCSSSLVCQLQSNDYPHPEKKWYPLIVERYGNETIQCPARGLIQLSDCADERGKPANIAPSAAYTRQRRMCKQCDRRN